MFSACVILLIGIWALCFYRAPLTVWTPIVGVMLVLSSFLASQHWFLLSLFWLIYIALGIIINLSALRVRFITRHAFRFLRKSLPPMSKTEQEALDAGDTWFEGELFCGAPEWRRIFELEAPKLSTEEQSFLENQVEALCSMVDDWEVTHNLCDLPEAVWAYLKQERFFGMMIPKSYGGLEFSALAHSAIIMKIASHSVSTAVTTMVPNSLGPAELLLKYGTDEQKTHYLPGLASGDEIPCFALTAPEAGSDAGNMPDSGVVCEGQHDGQTVLGIELNWDKRYITLAPASTVLGLAFKMFDPDGLLGDEQNLGITVCLIPTSHPGVEVGSRHFPLNQAFLNGPTRGKSVFIPIDWIIGGQEMIGKGWRMLMECLSVGRAISLPALSTGCAKVSYRTTGAYATLRKQFRTSIGNFEGVQEAMGKIAGFTYLIESARLMTAQAADLHISPSVASAIAKYHLTEMMRTAVEAAMDIHAGRGVQMGPNNYIARSYQGIPVSITVEGANILTRNLIIFGQGAIRCHPYIRQEMEAASDPNEERALKRFDGLLFRHIGFGVRNTARTLFYGLFGSLRNLLPGQDLVSQSCHKLNRFSAALALVSDVAMLVLGGELKRKEALSARLGDVLSHLYLATAAMRYFKLGEQTPADEAHLTWAIEYCLNKIQIAFDGFFQNFPNRGLAWVLKRVVFPLGQHCDAPADKLTHKLVKIMMSDNVLRDKITQDCFIGDSSKPVGRLEEAFMKHIEVSPLQQKLAKAIGQGVIDRKASLVDQMAAAIENKLFTESEVNQLQLAEELRLAVMAVDEFSDLGSESCQSQVAA